MLVISRKKNQWVQAGPVRVTVTEIRGDRVKLGFDADAGVPILRSELVQQQQLCAEPAPLPKT
jgi:carbon storage regulator